jgi:hypothetical protein
VAGGAAASPKEKQGYKGGGREEAVEVEDDLRLQDALAETDQLMHALDKEGADPQQQQSRLRRRRRLWQAPTYLATVLIEVIEDATGRPRKCVC